MLIQNYEENWSTEKIPTSVCWKQQIGHRLRVEDQMFPISLWEWTPKRGRRIFGSFQSHMHKLAARSLPRTSCFWQIPRNSKRCVLGISSGHPCARPVSPARCILHIKIYYYPHFSCQPASIYKNGKMRPLLR